MRIPETHKHTCAICNAEYVSFTSTNWGTCDNCENRARQYILEETQDYDPEDVWQRNSCGELDLNEDVQFDLYEQLLNMFQEKFGRNPSIISDKCQDQLYEIINNNTPRPSIQKGITQ